MNRFLIVKRGCKACLEYKKAVVPFITRLPIDKYIRILDNWEFEVFGVKCHQVQDKLSEEDFKDYPLLFLDGQMRTSGEAKEQLKIYLKTFLKDDLFMEI